MAVSNEVLAERIEAFTRQTVSESQQTRRDIGNMLDQVGRFEDSLRSISERVTLHEQQPGHPISVLKISGLEKESEAAKKDIESLKKIVDLERDVSGLKVDVADLKSHKEAQTAYNAGRQSALSTQEKFVLLCFAAVGPIIMVWERL